MNVDLIIAIVFGLILFAAGWFASLRFARPPAPPPPLDMAAFERLFSRFIDNTTSVVGGLQEDIHGLREDINRVSTWAPGQEVKNSAQLTRFMSESSQDRAGIRDEIRALRRVVVGLALGMTALLLRSAYVIWAGM